MSIKGTGEHLNTYTNTQFGTYMKISHYVYVYVIYVVTYVRIHIVHIREFSNIKKHSYTRQKKEQVRIKTRI